MWGLCLIALAHSHSKKVMVQDLTLPPFHEAQRGNDRKGPLPIQGEGIQQILKTCKEFNVPCAAFAGPGDVEKRVEQGFRIIISGPTRIDRTLEVGKKVAGR